METVDSALKPAIRVRGLTKVYRAARGYRAMLTPWRPAPRICALTDVELDVEHGELVALLGPNGAGKTTLMKIIATLVAPTSGVAEVVGMNVARHPVRARERMGYVLTEERSFFWRLSCLENLLFFASLQGLYGRGARQHIQELASLLGLSELLGRRFSELSTGQKQRLAIARGLLGDPPVLLFDEATRSLDPGRAERVRRLVREVLVDRCGKAVLFATHDLREAALLSDRAVLMTSGRIRAVGPLEQLRGEVEEAFRRESAEEEEEFRSIVERGSLPEGGGATP